MRHRSIRWIVAAVALASMAGAHGVRAAVHDVTGFPRIAVWAFPGAWQDSTALFPNRCVGSFQPMADSVKTRGRTITVRFLRNRVAETRRDFGGYRVYRMEGRLDTTYAVLVRRFSVNHGDELLWHFSRVRPETTITGSGTSVSYPYRCNGQVVNDSVLTFVDPDSSGSFEKVCRHVDDFGRCLSIGDSVFKLVTPPGPHDGFRVWYSVTYEALNLVDNNFEDMFVPDSTNLLGLGPCGTPGDRSSCPNLNNKLLNATQTSVEATPGPTRTVQSVAVVPNPFRGVEAWDQPGGHEVHFVNLPPSATIRVYTVAGELVRELLHNDPVHDFERWDLRNASGHEISSGVYIYRVTSAGLAFQNRLVVVR